MISRYFVVLYKIIVSHSEYFCYFWMLFATLTNGGLLYLFYPAAIFGYAILVEEKPGKWFWFLVLTYTQLLIVINFLLMLNLWKVLLTDTAQTNVVRFFDSTNLGFKDVELD